MPMLTFLTSPKHALWYANIVFEMFICVRPSPSSVVVVLRPSVPSVRRRRPSSSSSVRPSVPSVRRRQAANPRPHANFRKKLQNMSPTATGLGASDRARSVVFFSRAEIAVRVENVGFTAETLLLYNFGPKCQC